MFSNIKIPDYFSSYKEDKIFLVDTDVLSDICKKGISLEVEKKLLELNCTLIYSLTSIMELGFGPSKLTPKEEADFFRNLYGRKSVLQNDIFVSDFHMKFKSGKINYVKGKWVGVSPDSHNWYASKKALISLMDNQNVKPKNAKKLQIDMLLSCASWNANAFIWSNNIKDHLLARYYIRHHECTRGRKRNSIDAINCLAKHIIPIFDTNLLLRVLQGESFNVYTEMKKKTRNIEIIKALEIAEKNNT